MCVEKDKQIYVQKNQMEDMVDLLAMKQLDDTAIKAALHDTKKANEIVATLD